MSRTYDDDPADYGADRAAGTMPRAVRALRVLLFVVAGLTVLLVIGGFLAAAGNAELMGRVFGAALPGLAALVLALLLPRRGRALWWCVVALQAVSMLLALGVLGRGDPRGLTNLVLPIVILVLALRRTSRAWFRGN